MKKITTLPVLLLISVHLFAQFITVDDHLKTNRNVVKFRSSAHQLLVDHLGLPDLRPMTPPVSPKETLSKFAYERLDSIVMEFNAGLWIPGRKMLFTWDAQQQLIKHENHEFDDVLMQMVPSDRYLFDYDVNGQISQRVTEYYDPTASQWVPDYKTEYTWNAGKMATSASYFWDSSISSWTPGSRGTYHYLPNGLLSYAIFEYWDDFTSQWEIGYKQELTYNTSNLITLDLYSFYDASLMQYVPGSKDEYVYHTNGKVSMVTSSFYDAFEMTWIPERKEESVYDANANETLLTGSQYNPFDSVWVFTYQKARTFDSLNNVTTEISSSFDELSGTWIPDEKMEYTYDNNFPFVDLLLPVTIYEDDDPEVLFNHKITKATSDMYDQTLQTWLPMMRADLYWTPVLIGVEEGMPRADLSVFPNPATEVVTITGVGSEMPLNFTMADMQGRVVLEQKVNDNERIGIQHLEPGMYVYQISNNARSLLKGKVLIVK